jgi:hypothetical protein
MPNNDQLTKSERLRLECFAQACNSSFTIKSESRPTLNQLFDHALQIETFLKQSNELA